MTDKLLVLTTTGSETEARKIAEMLVERRLAACVNIIPRIHSVYRWQGEVEHAEEFLLVAKTVKKKEEELHAAIHELHSYELPECISIPIQGGSAAYLQWITESLVKT
jgi:periplasmic divalent cation tolerance protein